MKVTLISPYPDITAFGLRTISSYLQAQGYATQLIFLPDPLGDQLFLEEQRYNDQVLEKVVDLCRGSDLIGLTVMTNFFAGAVQITEKLKLRLNTPIVWGGIHPTVRAEESLQYADLVCIGEGEETILELAKRISAGQNYTNIPGLWLREGSGIRKNPVRPLVSDLDKYPFPDFFAPSQYILNQSLIEPLKVELLIKHLQLNPVSQTVKKTNYMTLSGRGCPHNCSYCCNSNLRALYPRGRYLRWRSREHLIRELIQVKQRMPFVDYICFSDDSFFARNIEDLKSFSRVYKEEIGLPFFCLASPLTITEEKMDCLVEAGLHCLQMGIESGSEKMNRVYQRQKMTPERIEKALRIINRYKDRIMPPQYDFILDAPYETEEDLVETLQLIARMPKPYRLQLFSLVLYPGTSLYEKAKRDGLIKDERQEIYSKMYGLRKPSYFNLIFTLCKGGKFPKLLLTILTNKKLVKLLNHKKINFLYKLIFQGGRKAKTLKAKIFS
jgi:radical SAM superfamily enzyme YgiQ (UPF0313 family)